MENNVYTEAIKQLQTSNLIGVFAPVGIWKVEDGKDLWLDALCKKKSTARFFLAGIPPKLNALGRRRLTKLSNNGVMVATTPTADVFRMGCIIFDNVVIQGLSTATIENLEYILVEKGEYVQLYKEWFHRKFGEGKPYIQKT